MDDTVPVLIPCVFLTIIIPCVILNILNLGAQSRFWDVPLNLRYPGM